MRICVSSDWHGDWMTLGVRRHDEVARAVDASVDAAIEANAQCYVFAGDLTDPDSGGDTFFAQLLILRAAHRLSRAGVRVVAIAGNHDVSEDGTGATTLTPLRALELDDELVFVAETPRLFTFGDDQGDVAFLCLPFTAVSHGFDMAAMAEALWPKKDARVVVVAHLTVPGVQPGEETSEMPRGREVVFPFAATKRAALRINGHYHARQAFDPGDGGPAVQIPGSLARLTFGEQDHEPSFLMIDL